MIKRCFASNVAGGAEAKVSLSVEFAPRWTRQVGQPPLYPDEYVMNTRPLPPNQRAL